MGFPFVVAVNIEQVILIRVAAVGARDRYVGVSVFGRLGEKRLERLRRVQAELLGVAPVLAGVDAVGQVLRHIVARQQVRLVDQPQVFLVARRDVGQIGRHIDAVALAYALCVGFLRVLGGLRGRLAGVGAAARVGRQAVRGSAAFGGRTAFGSAAGRGRRRDRVRIFGRRGPDQQAGDRRNQQRRENVCRLFCVHFRFLSCADSMPQAAVRRRRRTVCRPVKRLYYSTEKGRNQARSREFAFRRCIFFVSVLYCFFRIAYRLRIT